ncbi:uncharacterized protein LOC122854951 isoform X1 [Aphidius gifuensis]|uniref:uncharacterized protein LOC122854951 isoform X1 n=1 Tax=Aphidius gifuensis TaxID=684658 RepID=UPI001CDC4E14|nr:uncharacterized protein LOC122854951 isoform X1 [Aphidius gifuensis]
MYTCTLCNESLSESKTFLTHLKNCHSNKNTFPCGFELCNRVFNSFNTIKSHIYRTHKKRNISTVQQINKKLKIDDIDAVVADSMTADNRNNTLDIIDAPCHIESHEQIPTTNNNESLILAARLYSYVDMPRNKTSEIINFTSDYAQTSLQKIKKNIIDKLSIDSEKSAISKIFENCTNEFNEFKTEHKAFKRFKELGTYIPPVSYLIGNRQEYYQKQSNQILKMIQVTVEFIPLRDVFKKFFELPHVYNDMINYIQVLKDSPTINSNFIQGNLWQKIVSHDENKLILPLFFYYDDYENDNPLGSHRGVSKCGAIYVSLPCLPPRYQAKLENIFLFVLFNTVDRKYFENEIIFSRIKDELEFLGSTGITINHTSGPITIFFKLSLILGDNLGMHYMLGFTESFSQHKFCRFCQINKKQINSVFSEKKCILRTKNSYELDIKKKKPKLTGIQKKSILFGVHGFHPITNASVDYAHDLLEGVCRYDMALILNHYIIVEKLFTLDELNSRIKGFYYGLIKNKPSEILLKQITKKKSIIMSASEMLTLIRHFSLIIGHYINKNDKLWEIFLLLKDIIDICTSYYLDCDTHLTLSEIITDYLTLRNNFFPNSMKPKHHFLLHYPRVLFLTGSLSRISTIRFEAKHRDGKRTSAVAISRLNVCKTIAIKHQLQLNYRFLMNESCKMLIYNKNLVRTFLIDEISSCLKIQEYLYPLSDPITKLISKVKELTWDGMLIKDQCVVVTASEEGPVFFEVNHIILGENNNFILIVKLLPDVFYDLHTQAYKLLTYRYQWKILTQNDLYSCNISYIVRAFGGHRFIMKNWW